MSNGTNPIDELNGLQAAVTNAVAGVIGRPVTVRNRDVDGFWSGSWPLILLRLSDFNLIRIAGGQTGLKGQAGREQNFYAVEIHDVIDPRSNATERVAASQSDLYALLGAILDYFDHLPHQFAPYQGTNTAIKVGEYVRFKQVRPFTGEEGEVHVVLAGVISVIGATRAQFPT